MRVFRAGVLLLLTALVVPALAADSKAKKKDSAPTADDFFGDMGTTKKSQDDLGSAMAGTKKVGAAQEDMTPKSALQDRNATVTMTQVFAAAKIGIGLEGCLQPRPGSDVKAVEAADFPYILQPFDVCARLESNRGRAVQVTFKIVTPKGRVVGTSEEVVDFTGKTQVDHVVGYPELTFPVPGMYFYRLEVEGVNVGQHQLFELKPKVKSPPPPTVDDMIK